jgi:hypothetical protein
MLGSLPSPCQQGWEWSSFFVCGGGYLTEVEQLFSSLLSCSFLVFLSRESRFSSVFFFFFFFY